MNGLFFIINPVAGNGKSIKIWKKIKKELEKTNITYRTFQTEYSGHAEVLARQVATIQNYHLKTIIVVGGEGTIHEVINGLATFQKVKIGFINAGNGHNLERELQLPSHPVKALRSILQKMNRRSVQYDLGEINCEGKTSSIHFIRSLEVGINVVIQKEIDMFPLKRIMNFLHLHSFMFIICLLKVLYQYKPTSLKVHYDGEMVEYENVWLSTVSNLPHRYNKMEIAENTNPKDGLLDATIIHSLSRNQIICLFLFNMKSKKWREDAISTFPCTSIKLYGDNSPVYADGEHIGEGPVSISVNKSNVTLIK
ncbi:hypothetical protein CHH83_17370 [Bacillus sp. 7586-K]|uniref:YegS/Rv2252/BmrU family lipid kinase n=1 Tax=Metabacillus niabensis TaxID=324854 RepID=A0ABT9YX22_9BACI|nr:YegS/Rv2252/BmrU family lipid kinase [Metabacillus niabensis]MDQ0224548.1 YegS/Rv2252/BmrU family lipid kinase [Metabacillus niabensis]PAD67722.1 hypothetical protein CHH83_17370 [Bacillus sp. 7586-K]